MGFASWYRWWYALNNKQTILGLSNGYEIDLEEVDDGVDVPTARPFKDDGANDENDKVNSIDDINWTDKEVKDVLDSDNRVLITFDVSESDSVEDEFLEYGREVIRTIKKAPLKL